REPTVAGKQLTDCDLRKSQSNNSFGGLRKADPSIRDDHRLVDQKVDITTNCNGNREQRLFESHQIDYGGTHIIQQHLINLHNTVALNPQKSRYFCMVNRQQTRPMKLICYSYSKIRDPNWRDISGSDIARCLKKRVNKGKDTWFAFYPMRNPNQDKTKRTNVIYQVNCNNCNKFYVGQTEKKLCTRIKEHNAAVRRHDPLSWISIHKDQEGHKFNLGKAKFWHTETRDTEGDFWKHDTPRGIRLAVRLWYYKHMLNDVNAIQAIITRFLRFSATRASLLTYCQCKPIDLDVAFGTG
ncbi:hypothetical protein CLF_110856, partial [Clonorchis sinensis]